MFAQTHYSLAFQPAKHPEFGSSERFLVPRPRPENLDQYHYESVRKAFNLSELLSRLPPLTAVRDPAGPAATPVGDGCWCAGGQLRVC